MKWMVWLLLALNAALFGYFSLLVPQPAATRPGHEPIRPEAMRILSDLDSAQLQSALAAVEGVAPKAAEPACFEWGSFPAGSAARALALLQGIGLAAETRDVGPREAVRYWVYLPPHQDLQEAHTRVEALRALGIADAFVVQEERWRYAISLGVFKEEASAERLANELRNRGVVDVVKAARNQKGSQSVIFIRDVAPAMADEIRKFMPDYPYAELRQVTCQ